MTTVLVVGASSTEPCGVRTYAELVDAHLCVENVRLRRRWWHVSSGGTLREWLTSARAFAARLSAPHEDIDVILWHYSVFTYGFRGIPIIVPVFVRALRKQQVPIVVFIHEYAYPWRRGIRGRILAMAHRLVLTTVVRAACALVVTTDARRHWFSTRRWLSRRPVVSVPVSSTLPLDGRTWAPSASGGELGVFGWGAERTAATAVVKGAKRAAAIDSSIALVLIGAPGPESAQANGWREAANAEGLPVAFTGLLGPAELVERLARVELAVFPDLEGPSSRKTTLALLLALGVPTVAVHGPDTWKDLAASSSLFVVEAKEDALTSAIQELASSRELRQDLSKAARSFYETTMDPMATMPRLARLLRHAERYGAK